MSEHTSENVLVQKITATTQSRIDAIHAQAKAEVADIERETQAHLEAMRAQASVVLRKKQAQQELVGVSKARQAANIRLQSAKRTAIDAAFASAFTELTEMSSDEYVSFFTKHVSEVVAKDSDISHVHSPKNRVDETTAVIKSALGSSAEVIPTDNVHAGLIIETANGVFDVTLARLMSEKRPALEIVVVNEVMAK